MNIAIITGASSGLGLEFARLLDTAGLDELWIVARRKERLERLSEQLSTASRVLALDLRKMEAVDTIGNLLQKHAATVTWLINNAGFGKVGEFASLELGTQLDMIAVNVRVPTHLTHVVLPYMRRGSRIIQVASAAGFQPLGHFAVYAATKAYLISLGYALAAELGPRGIHCMVAAPGPVRTEFSSISRADPAWRKAALTTEADARAVAEKALRDAERGKWVSIYGASKLTAIVARLLPHRLLAWFSARFLYVSRGKQG